MITGYTGTKNVVQGLDAGADDYLEKHFESDELLARIRSGLRIRSPGRNDFRLKQDVSTNAGNGARRLQIKLQSHRRCKNLSSIVAEKYRYLQPSRSHQFPFKRSVNF